MNVRACGMFTFTQSVVTSKNVSQGTHHVRKSSRPSASTSVFPPTHLIVGARGGGRGGACSHKNIQGRALPTLNFTKKHCVLHLLCFHGGKKICTTTHLWLKNLFKLIIPPIISHSCMSTHQCTQAVSTSYLIDIILE